MSDWKRRAVLTGLLAWSIPVWFIYGIVVSLVLWFIGLFLTPLAIATARTMTSPITGKEILNARGPLWLWGNDEDGFDPPWYKVARPSWGRWHRMYAWGALRNSVGNQRFLPIVNPRAGASPVSSLALGSGWVVRQGPFTRWESGGGLGIGWRIYPTDAAGVDAKDWRRWGTGFKISIP